METEMADLKFRLAATEKELKAVLTSDAAIRAHLAKLQ